MGNRIGSKRRGAVLLPSLRGVVTAGMSQAVWVMGTVTVTVGQALQELARNVARPTRGGWPTRDVPVPDRLDDEDPLDTPPAF